MKWCTGIFFNIYLWRLKGLSETQSVVFGVVAAKCYFYETKQRLNGYRVYEKYKCPSKLTVLKL